MEKKSAATVSIVILAINLVFCISAFFAIKGFPSLYETLGGELSVLTRIALQSRYLFPAVALMLIAKEFLKNRHLTLKINIIVLIILIASGFLYGICLFLPIFNLPTLEIIE